MWILIIIKCHVGNNRYPSPSKEETLRLYPSSRWESIPNFSGGDKGLAYMKIAPRNSGTLIGAKYRCAVIDSRGITLAKSDNCNWLD